MIENKRIFFYNAIPMPHSILLHRKLVEAGYTVDFWYYKGLTKLYPWSQIDEGIHYNIYDNNDWAGFKKIVQQSRQSQLMIITGWHTWVHIYLILYSAFFQKKMALWIDVNEQKISMYKFWRNYFLLKISRYLFVTGKYGIKIISNQFGIKSSKMEDFPYVTAVFAESEIKQINCTRVKILENGEQIRLLISNRFIERKGYNVVIEALKILDPDSLQKYDITILGIGPDFDIYKNKFAAIKGNIKLMGWVEYEVYLDYIKNTDVYLHASISEPYGIPPMDAISCGKLVIGSSGVISCMDKIINGINGFIYDKQNAFELSDILTKISLNPDKIYKMGEKAFEIRSTLGYQHNVNVINSILK